MILGTTNIGIPGGDVTMEHILESFTLSADHLVESYDMKTGECKSQPICSTRASSSRDFMMIKTEDNELQLTLDHKIYVQNREEWVVSKNLRTGWHVLNREGEPVEIVDVVRLRRNEMLKVYTVALAEHSNYYANDILVHCQNVADCDE